MPGDCFRINGRDNVATMLTSSDVGPTKVRNSNDINSVQLLEPIELGHKVALVDIAIGEAIIKFGVPIGTASQPIRSGAWVHLHNCMSSFDARSGTLDPHSGATTDTRYE